MTQNVVIEAKTLVTDDGRTPAIELSFQQMTRIQTQKM